MKLCSNKEVAGIFRFYILIYVFLGGLEQRFESRTRPFYDMVTKVLCFSLTLSLTVLLNKTSAIRSPKICLPVFLFVSSPDAHWQNIYILNKCSPV